MKPGWIFILPKNGLLGGKADWQIEFLPSEIFFLEAISKMVFMQKAAVNVMLSGAKHP